MIQRWLLVGLLLAAISGSASAQQGTTVTTTPEPVSSVDASGTIAVTSTFQQVFAAAGGFASPATRNRRGCLIQNNGANMMWVFVGPVASATKATAYQIQPPGTGTQGGSFNCATGGGGVVQNAISITGTSGDAFTAAQQ